MGIKVIMPVPLVLYPLYLLLLLMDNIVFKVIVLGHQGTLLPTEAWERQPC